MEEKQLSKIRTEGDAKEKKMTSFLEQNVRVMGWGWGEELREGEGVGEGRDFKKRSKKQMSKF